MTDKISVIIPAYNSGKHIKRCLESIQNSTYKNLEIIIINDGSSDNTKDIVENYVEDKRIILINKQNEGVSSARNTGIDIATGEYIVFVDSDDYVSEYFIERLFESCKTDVDIACCRFVKVNEFGERLDTQFEDYFENFEVTPHQIANSYFEYLNIGIVNFPVKMFRRSVIGNTRFSTLLKWGEDGSFNLQIFRKMRKMAVITDELYFYVMHGGQATSRKMSNFDEMMIKHISDIHSYISNYNGYKNKNVKNGMGRIWLRMFVAAVRHADNLKNYKSTFYKFKEQPWYAYIKDHEKIDLKWSIIKKIVSKNHYVILYFSTKLHQTITKRKFG